MRPAGGKWAQNFSYSIPFPCPQAARPPGPGSPVLPPDVMKVWNLSFAPGCATANYPTQF